MRYGFEFDPVNKILLLRFEGPLSEKSLTEAQQAARKYWAATDPSAGIVDFSSVTEFALSTAFLHALANQELGEPANHPRVIVAPATVGFGLSRMFQILGERKRPLLTIVHTMDEAFATLGVKAPRFEPLE